MRRCGDLTLGLRFRFFGRRGRKSRPNVSHQALVLCALDGRTFEERAVLFDRKTAPIVARHGRQGRRGVEFRHIGGDGEPIPRTAVGAAVATVEHVPQFAAGAFGERLAAVLDAEIRETFKVPNIGIIGGAYIVEGKVKRNAQVRLVRDGIVIHEGTISSLRRFKDDAKEVAQGYECGIGIEAYNDIKPMDIIECFHMVEIER